MKRAVAIVVLALLFGGALPANSAHGIAIKDMARETPQQREARDQLVLGNLSAVVDLFGEKSLKGRKPTPPERVLLGRALLGLSRLKEARSALKPCKTRAECALSAGLIELRIGDRRAALRILGAAMKRHRDHVRIRVAFGEALYAVGQGYQARQLLDPLADRYAARQITAFVDQIAVARSLALNGYFKDANQVLADANEAVANRAERKLLEVTWATLFLSKSNFRDADVGFRKALQIDPGYTPAIIGMVRIDLDSDHAPRKAKKRLDKALLRAPTDPRLLSARAEVALMDEDLPTARKLLAKALKTSPTHGDALAVLYATCSVADDRSCARKALKTSLKVNRHDPQPHLLAARYLEAGHRYDRVLTELKLALKRDPDSAAAHAALGMSYARLADDKKSFAHLDTAFRTDGYNVRTANVLNVLYDGVLKHMRLLKGEFVDLRVHRKHRQAFERTVLPFLQESYEVLAKKYAFKPKQPLRVEIFPTTEQFSVRTVGLPRLGAHAVCFGHLITSRSPTEKPFNWKMVLHHEMAHIFHIQMTDGRVPRWLTEGLAMMESVWLDERYHMRMERRAFDRLKAGKLSKLRSFNLAFSQARTMAEIVDAYYQAMKFTQFMSDTFGFVKVRKLVAAYASGRSTAVLIKRVFGRSPERLDADFAAWLGKNLGRFERDFRPTKATMATLLERLKKRKSVWKKQKAADLSDKKPTLDTAMRRLAEALKALARSDHKQAMQAFKQGSALAARTKAVATSPAWRQRDVCAMQYLLADLALAKRDWLMLKAATEALVAQPGRVCDGVRPRLLLARALRAQGKDQRTQILLHLRKAAEINGSDAALKRLWLAALPKDAAESERRRLMVEILRLSPNEAVLGMKLAALAWKRLAPSVAALAVRPSGPKKTTTTTAKPPLTAADRASLVTDVRRGARQLEETVPHSYQQALWEARVAVLGGHLKMALPVYRLAATRARRAAERRAAWCELAQIAGKTGSKAEQGEADRRCAVARRKATSGTQPTP